MLPSLGELMTENPYKAPEAELPVRTPKLLRTVTAGALWGVAVGFVVSMLSTLMLKYGAPFDGDIYWPGHLANCVLMYVLPLTVIGSFSAFVIGVVRMLIYR